MHNSRELKKKKKKEFPGKKIPYGGTIWGAKTKTYLTSNILTTAAFVNGALRRFKEVLEFQNTSRVALIDIYLTITTSLGREMNVSTHPTKTMPLSAPRHTLNVSLRFHPSDISVAPAPSENSYL